MLPWGIYSLLALLVLGPLVQRGYVFALDMVFAPHIRMPVGISSTYVFRALLHYLNFVLPSDIIEKILLFVILLLAGRGMHRLALHLNNKKPHSYDAVAAYFAGTLFMINPFTYERFMAGQYLVVFGYALLPWFTCALLHFLNDPRLRPAIFTAVWALAISIVSIHAIGFTALIAVFAVGVKLWQLRNDKQKTRTLLKFAGISLAIFLLASSYWLVPLAAGKGTTAETISSFSTNDQTAFATVGQGWVGRLGNVLHLQGFWVEDTDTFTMPQANMAMWEFLIAFIWILIITGTAKFLRERRTDIIIIFGGSAAVATILAVGTFNNWLANNIPLFAGYREPQKFVAVIALCLVLFAARGAAAVLKYSLGQGGRAFLLFASVILLAIPLIWTHTMLWAFDNQLFATNYPPAWFTINQKLNADRGNFQALFLPWHLYMGFIFAGHIIANPAPQFFDKPVIVSDNPEFEGIAPSNTSPAKRKLDRILHGYNGDNLGAQLAQLNIKYVILDKDDDYQKYLYVNKQTDLQLMYKSDTINLYRNLGYRG